MHAAPDPLLVGLDGGASGVRAWAVERVSAGERAGSTAPEPSGDGAREPVLATVGAPFEETFERTSDFTPLALGEQLAGAPRSAAERARAEHCLDTAARCAAGLARGRGATAVRLAACLPGLKTADGRGLRAALHLPRIPDWLGALRARLEAAGLKVGPSLERLPGDGHCAGLGERHAREGRLRGVANGYYVGGGTGLAEAFLVRGRVLSDPERERAFPRAFELRSESGASFEELLSVAGLNRAAGAPDAGFPEQRAESGDGHAAELFARAARALAELTLLRAAAFHALEAPLERLVIGQRLGLLWRRPALAPQLARVFERELARRAAAGHHPGLRAPRAPDGTRAPDFAVASDLRAAPALGAVALLLRETRTLESP